MAVNDPVGDMLTRIRNAQMRRKTKVSTPGSKLRARVLDVLAVRGLHPRLLDHRVRQRPLGVRDRAQVLRR
jgi:hypothetical protein